MLGLLAVLVTVGALFDWNWLRHPLERYLAERSQREIRIGDLHVDLGFSLEPTVRVRDVYVENAPWASKGPTAVAGEASFTFSLRSVWEGRPIISRLVLIDADVQLEALADGLRNWRLRNPEDRGPGRVKVLRIEPHRSRIQIIRRDNDLDVVAATSEAGADGQAPGALRPTQIEFKGSHRGTAFSGQIQTGAVLTLMGTGESFSLRGHASTGKSRFDVEGTVADLFKPSVIDAKIRVAGNSLSELDLFSRSSLPATRPYAFEAHVKWAQNSTSFEGLRGAIGGTDLAGKLSLDLSQARPMLRAELRSESADLRDLASLLGTGHPGDDADDEARAGPDGAGPARTDSRADDSGPPTSRRLFSNRAFNGERLQTLDAHLVLDARKLTAAAWPELESLRVTAHLDAGILALKPIDIGLSGGHVVGLLKFDGRRKPLSSQVSVEFKAVRIEKLLDRLAKGARSTGALNGSADLTGKGDSVASILATSSGSVEVSMEGGSISNLLDAKLSLRGGNILRLLMTGDRAIGIHSAVVAFGFDRGLGRSKTMLLDTDQTRTEGEGTIDLREEAVDVLLTPHPKKPGIWPLGSSIRVHGSIRQPEISLQGKSKQSREEENRAWRGRRSTAANALPSRLGY